MPKDTWLINAHLIQLGKSVADIVVFIKAFNENLLTLFLNKIDHRGSSVDSEQAISGEQQAMQVLGSSLATGDEVEAAEALSTEASQVRLWGGGSQCL